MRKIKMVFMRGGTSKGCIFHREDLPADRNEWDRIFLQVMGNPDPKQIDGMGGTVSSNNKVVIVWKSDKPDVDIEYLVGQVIVGKNQVDYKSNCGNMTSAVGPFAIEEKMVKAVEPITTIHLFNCNTDKYIDVTVPCENGAFALEGDCAIAGIDGTAAEIKVAFLNPAGAKTGTLLPTGNRLDVLDIEGHGKIEVTILDVSNPLVIVRAGDIGLNGRELPDEVNQNQAVCDVLEKIRGTAAVLMGFAKNCADAAENSPAVPKIGFFTMPQTFKDLTGKTISKENMDVCVRVISVFKCHKAVPLTSASGISVACHLEGSILYNPFTDKKEAVRIGHPSGVMTMIPVMSVQPDESVEIHSVAVQRTARRIMDGNVYIRK